uniref:Uncharacterized protein n=1 Tax=Physcomitrium patens TaxID=3218 RepID=A0A2K1L999_PHYPA|nr:hypothetical protein PHYPA_001040 [Physcomitrium patens]
MKLGVLTRWARLRESSVRLSFHQIAGQDCNRAPFLDADPSTMFLSPHRPTVATTISKLMGAAEVWDPTYLSHPTQPYGMEDPSLMQQPKIVSHRVLARNWPSPVIYPWACPTCVHTAGNGPPLRPHLKA